MIAMWTVLSFPYIITDLSDLSRLSYILKLCRLYVMIYQLPPLGDSYVAVTEYNATTSCVVLLSCYYIIIMLDGHGHAIIMQICGCQWAVCSVQCITYGVVC